MRERREVIYIVVGVSLDSGIVEIEMKAITSKQRGVNYDTPPSPSRTELSAIEIVGSCCWVGPVSAPPPEHAVARVRNDNASSRNLIKKRSEDVMEHYTTSLAKL